MYHPSSGEHAREIPTNPGPSRPNNIRRFRIQRDPAGLPQPFHQLCQLVSPANKGTMPRRRWTRWPDHRRIPHQGVELPQQGSRTNPAETSPAPAGGRWFADPRLPPVQLYRNRCVQANLIPWLNKRDPGEPAPTPADCPEAGMPCRLRLRPASRTLARSAGHVLGPTLGIPGTLSIGSSSPTRAWKSTT